MTQQEMAHVMDEIMLRMNEFREAGQREYSHREDNAFGNFERVGERLSLSREAVLLVYLEKHLDGIHSYVKGHRSQRENVEGRIIDAIVYLSLLYGMVVERRETEWKPVTPHGKWACFLCSQELAKENGSDNPEAYLVTHLVGQPCPRPTPPLKRDQQHLMGGPSTPLR